VLLALEFLLVVLLVRFFLRLMALTTTQLGLITLLQT
jgi:hypothetical protein